MLSESVSVVNPLPWSGLTGEGGESGSESLVQGGESTEAISSIKGRREEGSSFVASLSSSSALSSSSSSIPGTKLMFISTWGESGAGAWEEIHVFNSVDKK